MDAIVTGGAGFIGSHLVHRLVETGSSTAVIDNFFSGNEENLSDIKEKIKILKGSSGEIASLLKEDGPEVVFHQGIYSSSPMYKEAPTRTAKAVEDFINVLEFARKTDARVVFASSSSVYNGIEPPHREDAKILVTDYYTEARHSMERLAELYNSLYGTSAIGLRYFSVYGEREFYKRQYANLISQFLWAAKKGERPLVFGDGKQTRDFTYVEDIVDANILASKSNIKFGIYNTGTGREVSINEMVSILAEKLGLEIKPQYKENKIKNYVARTRADTAKAKRELGFEAKVSLEDGIGRLVEFYEKQ